MPYIDRHGRLVEKQPWGLQRLLGIFWGIVAFFTMFLRSLFGQNVNRAGSSYSRDYRGGGGPPKPPSNKRIQGFKDLPECNAPGGG